MRLSLDALMVLDSIDRNGSFAAAAEELHRVPSAVTYAVQKLEQDLNVSLFARTGRRAQLTPAGQELLHEGRRLLRAAQELEARTQRVAHGWEAELRIAVSDLIPLTSIYPLVQRFYQTDCGTRLRISTEVLGGGWDALFTGRADLIVGADGEGPPGGGYAVHPWAEVQFVFAVAPQHPLAASPEPLTSAELLRHRAISAADSSRHLAPRTVGLLSGQDVLTVPDTAAKLRAQRLGVGVGFVPRHLVQEDFAQGTLVAKQVEEEKPKALLSLAWRTSHRGKALHWFVKELKREPLI